MSNEQCIMKTMELWRPLAAHGASAALGVTLVLAAWSCAPAIDATFDDPTITARIATALLNAPVVSGLRIEVETFRGHVTLSGDVASAAQIAQAMTIARQVDGVIDVESRLRVMPPPPP